MQGLYRGGAAGRRGEEGGGRDDDGRMCTRSMPCRRAAMSSLLLLLLLLAAEGRDGVAAQDDAVWLQRHAGAAAVDKLPRRDETRMNKRCRVVRWIVSTSSFHSHSVYVISHEHYHS